MTDPLVHQHQTTEGGRLVEVQTVIAHTATGRRTRTSAYRREIHARLWDKLTTAQQDAADHIERCHAHVTGPVACRIGHYGPWEPKGQPSHEASAILEQDWRHWRSGCKKERLNADEALRIIQGGQTIRSVVRLRRMDHRTVTRRFCAALDVMVRLKGWR